MAELGDAERVLACCRTVLRALGESRQEIDAVNVFPIADSDTGTNLYLTVEEGVAAAQAESEAAEPTVATVVDAFARGAFIGARGNSGAIFAQFARGLADSIREPDVERNMGGRSTPTSGHSGCVGLFVAGLRAGVDAAYAAVGQPVEGTMLTVARAAADAAAANVGSVADPALVDVVSAALEAARRALDDTPAALEVLRRAGVVDAGGLGVVVALEAGRSELTGQPWPSARRLRESMRMRPVADEEQGDDDEQGDGATVRHEMTEFGIVGQEAPGSPVYEVTYLLEAPEESVTTLRGTLGSLGDSLVVAGSTGAFAGGSTGGHAKEWNVHVHVHDAGAAIEAGLNAGRVRRICVTAIEPTGPAPRGHGAARASAATRRVVALVTGAGLGDIWEQAGATVVRRDRTGRPSIADLVDVLRAESADEIIVLPNDRDMVPLAEAAVDTVLADTALVDGSRITVIPTVAEVPGMAAFAIHDPTRAYDVDLVAMTAAAGRTRPGAVTMAADGDVMGTVDGVVAVIGDDPVTVASDVVARLLGPGGELVTIVVGAGCSQATGQAVAASVQRDHPEVDVVVVAGDQVDPILVVGVE